MEFTSITAFAIAPALQPGSVLIGTADKGRIYSVTNDGRDTLLLQSSEGQISSFLRAANQIYAASSNQGKLFRFGQELVAEGSYESPVRDAKLTASWGRIWWRGNGNVELQTRTGNGERPDATWSEWSASYRDPDGNPISSPRARFVQWRATLRSGGNAGQTWMEDASLAYLPRNVAPEVLSISSLPIGVGLQQIAQTPDRSERRVVRSGSVAVRRGGSGCRRGEFFNAARARFNGRPKIEMATRWNTRSTIAR